MSILDSYNILTTIGQHFTGIFINYLCMLVLIPKNVPFQSLLSFLSTLVRLIMTGNIVAGKNNGGINMADLPKNRQI